MSRDQILSKIESAGYTAKPYQKQSNGIVVYYGQGGSKNKASRVSFLKDIIAPMINGTYKATTSIKSSVGGVVVGSVIIITKPETDVNGSLASLDARIFSKLGKRIKYTYADETFDAVEFTDKEVIKKSIAAGIQDASMLDDSLVESLQSLYDGYGINWSPQTDEATRNKLGVYLGEMLIGMIALGTTAAKQEYMKNNIFGTKPGKRFILPIDPSFSGVDSFIEMADGTLFPVSSKFGVGAKASIFTNLMVKAVKNKSSLPRGSVIRQLADIITSNNLKPTDSREIVYAYGVREILGISSANIKNPGDVYSQIRTGKLGKEAKLAIAKASSLKTLPSPLRKFEPQNMSYLFNMIIAERLNKDKASMDAIKVILAGKKYWQINLDQTLWKAGKLKFGAVLSGEATVRIIGNKTPSTDITAKQGWINYELKLV